MAQFPNAEADIVALANAMVAGYGAHAVDFPSSDVLGLTTALTGYSTAKTAQTDALAVAQVAGESEQAAASADRLDAQEHSGGHADVVFMDKSFKGDYSKFKGDYSKFKGKYGKSEGSKGLRKITVSEYENVYITDKGERWYVTENPDGTITKMQMQEIDGEYQPVGKANVYRSEGGKGK